MSEHEKEMRKIVFIYFVLIKSRQSDQRELIVRLDETLYYIVRIDVFSRSVFDDDNVQ